MGINLHERVNLAEVINFVKRTTRDQSQSRRDSPRQPTSFWLAAKKNAKIG
jgi:hypothetical protein